MSVVSTMPLPPSEPMFSKLLALAFELGITTPEMLCEKLSTEDILTVALRDKERVRSVYLRVMMMEGPFAEKFVAQLDLTRITADIALAVVIDPEAAARLIYKIDVDVDFFVKHMSFVDFYRVVSAKLIKEDLPAHRAFGGRMCEALVEYQAFGAQHETERSIMKSIGIDVLCGDKMPSALRARMMNAIYRGGQDFKDEHRPMYACIFDPSVKGVSFSELAEHLEAALMVRPFAAYMDRLGLLKTSVVKPSVFPPRPPFQPPMPLLLMPNSGSASSGGPQAKDE